MKMNISPEMLTAGAALEQGVLTLAAKGGSGVKIPGLDTAQERYSLLLRLCTKNEGCKRASLRIRQIH